MISSDPTGLINKFLALSSSIGRDWSLCQNQGGNTSYKCGGILTIKASGKSLSEATTEPSNTFISDLDEDFQSSNKRFSIETPLHRILDHKYVFHFHPVDFIALSCLRKNEDLARHLLDSIEIPLIIDIIPYAQPGNDLAIAVQAKSYSRNQPLLLLLESHGVVIASESVDEANFLINKLKHILNLMLVSNCPGYSAIKNLSLKLLNSFPHLPITLNIDNIKLNHTTFKWLIQQDSYLYPDHAIFFAPLATLFAENKNIKKPNQISCEFDDKVMNICLPQVTSHSHRDHAILILIQVLLLSSFECQDLALLPSTLLNSLISSEEEIYRLTHG